MAEERPEPVFPDCRLIRLAPDDPWIDKEIVRVYGGRLDADRRDPGQFWRRQAVTLRHEATGRWVVRHAMGPGQSTTPQRHQLAVDYDAHDYLRKGEGADPEESGPVTVYPARYREIVRYYLTHPDASMRVAMQMAGLSVALGLIGALAGILSLTLALV